MIERSHAESLLGQQVEVVFHEAGGTTSASGSFTIQGDDVRIGSRAINFRDILSIEPELEPNADEPNPETTTEDVPGNDTEGEAEVNPVNPVNETEADGTGVPSLNESDAPDDGGVVAVAGSEDGYAAPGETADNESVDPTGFSPDYAGTPPSPTAPSLY